MNPVIIQQGDSPVILGQPHGGTYVPDDLRVRLNVRGRGLDDTDWHINRLYDGLVPGVSVVRASFHRYVIDANRDPADVSLYPGQNTTALCPLTDFDGRKIWCDGQQPSDGEIIFRRNAFHEPYHVALSSEIARIKQLHGYVILIDCHSIRSNIPYLFDGTLPVFNIGTNNGTTCDPLIEQTMQDICAKADKYDHVTNGRFKGGWSTRHYGKPQMGVHAIQMELAQRTYMDEVAPWAYRDSLATQVRPTLSRIMQSLSVLSLAI